MPAACRRCSASGTTRPARRRASPSIQIRQRYPGHARQALHVAAACQGGAYAGKWTVVVDEDIDAGELDQVLWAMCTRFDPKVDIDLIQKAWASKRDPLFLPGNFNNRILVDACIPYDMKLKGTFPVVGRCQRTICGASSRPSSRTSSATDVSGQVGCLILVVMQT